MTNGLAALLAKKAAEKNGTNLSDSNDSQASSGVSESAPESNDVPSAESIGATETQRPKNPFGGGKNSGPNDSSGPARDRPAASGGEPSSGEQSRSGLASLSLKPKSQSSDSDTGSVAPHTIESLDDLDASEDAGIAPRQSITSHFSDETPAQKPTRELPEGLTKEQLGFVDMIDGVYDVIHEPDLMGGVIRNIIIELKDNPEYMKLVAPDDVRVWVRGMRDSMGLAKIKKTESKARKSGGSGKKSKLVDDDMLSDLADLGVDIPS